MGRLLADVPLSPSPPVPTLPWHLEIKLEAGIGGFLTKDDVEALDARENAVLEVSEHASRDLLHWGSFTHAGVRSVHAQLHQVAGLRRMLAELHNGAETAIRYDPRWQAYRSYIQ